MLLDNTRVKIDEMAVSWNAEEKQACLEETLSCFMFGSSLMSYIRPPPVPKAGGCPVPHWALSSTVAWPIRRIEYWDQGRMSFDNSRYSTIQCDVRLHCNVPLYIFCFHLNWIELNWIFGSHPPPSSWSIWPPITATCWTHDLCSCPPFYCFLSCSCS